MLPDRTAANANRGRAVLIRQRRRRDPIHGGLLAVSHDGELPRGMQRGKAHQHKNGKRKCKLRYLEIKDIFKISNPPPKILKPLPFKARGEFFKKPQLWFLILMGKNPDWNLVFSFLMVFYYEDLKSRLQSPIISSI
jgi:hypothetical protein